MSQKNAFDNIMNYFNEEEEEEEEEESNFILNFNKSKGKKKKKSSSLKQVNTSKIIDNNNEEKENNISENNNNLDNNYISYFGNNSSRPETPRLNNNIKEEKIKNQKNIENNDEIKLNNIFTETLTAKVKDINNISLDNKENIEYNENSNIRQTFSKNEQINDNIINDDKEESNKNIILNNQENIFDKNDNELVLNKDESEQNKNIESKTFSVKGINEIFNEEDTNKYFNKNNNNYENKYNDEIKKKKLLLLGLQKNKEKIKNIENLNINKDENNKKNKNKALINKDKNNNIKNQLIKSKSSDLFNVKNKNNISSYLNEKIISNIIIKNSENNKNISIIGVIKSLCDLKIINLLLLNNNIDIYKLKEIIEKIEKDEKENQKKKELEFIEQLWFLLNQNNKEFISNEIFECFLKLLYPYTINLKQSAISYIKEYIKIINFMEPNNCKKNIGEYFHSPLRLKWFSKNELWSIEKIVQTFFELKRNSLAYKKKNGKLNNEENKDNNNTQKNKKRNNFNFDKLYNSFMLKKKIREKTLEIMREEQEKENKEELEKYTYIPKICKKNEKILKDSNINNYTVYDKLYMRRNDRKKIIEKLKDKYKVNIKEENYSFKPEIIKNVNLKEKFEKNSIPKNCKKYIRKNLELIRKKKEEKIKEEQKYNGSNFDKVKKIVFKCEGPLYEQNKDRKRKNKENKNISIMIKLPNGKDVTLDVNLDENIEEKIDDFCKIYSLNDNIKEKIINQIETYINIVERDSFI